MGPAVDHDDHRMPCVSRGRPSGRFVSNASISCLKSAATNDMRSTGAMSTPASTSSIELRQLLRGAEDRRDQ